MISSREKEDHSQTKIYKKLQEVLSEQFISKKKLSFTTTFFSEKLFLNLICLRGFKDKRSGILNQ
jgi:hypothetical protein